MKSHEEKRYTEAYRPMSDYDWTDVAPHFRKDSKTDRWEALNRIDAGLVHGLFELRKLAGKPIHLHCGVEERDTAGFHPQGLAVAPLWINT